jgi:hypothetical protein
MGTRDCSRGIGRYVVEEGVRACPLVSHINWGDPNDRVVRIDSNFLVYDIQNSFRYLPTVSSFILSRPRRHHGCKACVQK